DVRVVEAGRSDNADERTRTRLFSAVDSALRDVPPSRVAGTIMVTDGQVHDVPAAGASGGPLHVLITGEEDEFDRRIQFERAPRFGIVSRAVEMTYRVVSTGDEQGPVTVRLLVNGKRVSDEQAIIGQETALEIVVPN